MIDPASISFAESEKDGAFFHGVRRSVGMGVMNQIVDISTQDFLRFVPEHLGGGLVDEGAKAAPIDAVDPLGR